MSSPFCVGLHVCVIVGLKCVLMGFYLLWRNSELRIKKINDKSGGKEGQNENVRITTSVLKFPLSFVKDEMSGWRLEEHREDVWSQDVYIKQEENLFRGKSCMFVSDCLLWLSLADKLTSSRRDSSVFSTICLWLQKNSHCLEDTQLYVEKSNLLLCVCKPNLILPLDWHERTS